MRRVSQVTVRKRIWLSFVIGSFLFVSLIGRLGYVQLAKGQWLADKAEDLWSRDIPVEAKRGKIFTRDGEVLAYNVSAPSVMAIPVQIKDPNYTAKELANILGMNQEKIYKLITQRELIVRVARKIPEEKAVQIEKLKLPGIAITEESKRYYPEKDLASHVLGFVGIDNQGLAGIEVVYDDLLKGKNGAISFYADAKGREMPNQSQRFTPPKNGYDLVLTIDKNIQSYIERELDQAVVTYNPDHAIAIAMDPNTGEILGMASRPNYDPSRFKEYPSEVYNRNLPIWMAYEPGSTFKIITLAASLQEKTINLDDHFFDPGYIKVADSTLHCWKDGGHGSETFLQVVENSCNPGFVVMGQKLGGDKLYSYIKNFGFGEKTGIDLYGEQKGILFNQKSMLNSVNLATTSFGQGVSVTPIQQVAAVAAAINGGKLLTPHLLKEVRDPETGDVLKTIQPQIKRQVISPETSKQVRQTLESVVSNGTGRNAYIDGYRIGGKTGTAQKVGPNGGYLDNNYIVSFIGFAPADKPEVVIYVAIDNPKGTVQFGGTVAAPIVKNIIDSTLQYLEIPKRKDQLEKKYRYGIDIPYVEVPNLIGQTKNDIIQSLYTNFTLEVEGTGNVVLQQIPKPGTRVEKGSTLRIYMGDNPKKGD
ncbi:stage V sporulation protein D [Tepidibacillus fermentans]|uniref:serine-type D-Ala-D-Ala carboxypeptidase n=1 Tax=Tepidibacillus fermentans TaxID=1281767 RepID=A0A4V2UT68_9BACI|nr:stage V sporulation protein D [Tepidibacillus fermentans]TCS84419.1 stage V sporulation protein D (sporulation-specific penicillin-binding protein) [Tepidibacillus fermentans]